MGQKEPLQAAGTIYMEISWQYLPVAEPEV